MNLPPITDKSAIRFANVSGVTGWNLEDDARAVVRCDWDSDGDLDFWVANRTAPQVRFMRNELSYDQHSMAFRLSGTKSNRDAIGSKIIIETKGGQRQTRTIRAGEGFLSQSSKVAHFGLGANSLVTSVAVRWPDGVLEIFSTPQNVDATYRLVEGSGEAVFVKSHGSQSQARSQPSTDRRANVAVAGLSHDPSTQDISAPCDRSTAHRLHQPMPLPPLRCVLSDGTSIDASTPSDGVLLNLWSPSCQDCLKELHDWAEATDEIRRLGIRPIALSVEAHEDASSYLTSIDFPFDQGNASSSLLELAQLVHNTVYKDDHRPLPIPTSFLIDRRGHLAAVYKGPVAVGRIAEDVSTFDIGPSELAAKSLPFPGRWLGKPGPHSLSKLNDRLWEFDFKDVAAQYAHRLPSVRYRKEKIKLLLSNSIRFRERADKTSASQQLRLLLDLAPDHPAALLELGTTLARKGDLENAIVHLTKAVDGFESPNANAHLNLGIAMRRLKRTVGARAHIAKAIELEPGLAAAHSSLGLLLAGEEQYSAAAQSFARAVELEPSDVEYRVNLSAAFMRTGKLAEAIVQLDRAIALDEDSIIAYVYRSQAHLQLGDLESARMDLDFVLDREPSNVAHWVRRGDVCERQGDMRSAVASFRKALQIDPNQPPIASRAAWILATHPDASLRDGVTAVRLAEQAALATERQVAPVLDVLAAAYAETDRFEKATITVDEALARLRDADENALQSPLYQQIANRREGYRQRIKFRNALSPAE